MSRTKIFQLISISIGLFFGLLFGEIICRVYYFGKDALSVQQINSYKPMGVSGFLKAADNSKVLYDLKPNLDDLFKQSIFQTNAQGNRDKPYSIQKPPSTTRGVVIGDSFTMGSGVDIENVYHSVVEQKINERNKDSNFEIINFGVGGYNLLNYLGIMESKILPYQPDFIILGFCGNNDFFIPSEKHYQGDYKVKIKKKRRGLFYSSFLKFFITNLIDAQTPSRKTIFEINPPQIEFMENLFSQFGAFSRKNNIPIIINYLSFLEDNGNLNIVKELARKNDIFITDSVGKFDYENVSQYFICKFDQHPNEEAHYTFAESLLNSKDFLKIINQ